MTRWPPPHHLASYTTQSDTNAGIRNPSQGTNPLSREGARLEVVALSVAVVRA
jgi:hypothetical protein